MTNFARHKPRLPVTPQQIAWERRYQQLLREFLLENEEFDGSALCVWMRKRGLHDPEHHNHWATQIHYYAGQGWFTKVGVSVPTKGHAHINTVALWRSNFYAAEP